MTGPVATVAAHGQRFPAKPPTPLPAVDIHGDALPTGARLRLGTERNRARGARPLLFLPNEGPLTAWSVDEGHLTEVDVASGKKLRRLGDLGSVWHIQAPRNRSFVLFERSNQVEKHDLEGKLLRAFSIPGKAPAHPLIGSGSSGFCASEDGSRLAVWADRTIVLYNLITGAVLSRLKIPVDEDASMDATSSPSLKVTQVVGDHVVLIEGGNQFRRSDDVALWDLKKRRKHFTVEGSVALSSDGRHVAVFGSDELRWQTIDGKVLQRKAFSETPVLGRFKGLHSLRVSDDGSRIIGSQSGSIRVYSTSTFQELAVVPQGNLRAMSPNGRRLALERDGFIYVTSTSNVGLPSTPAGHVESIDQLVFSPDGDVISTVSGGTWRTWDADTGETLRLLRPTKRFGDDYRAITMSQTHVLARRGDDLHIGRRGNGAINTLVATEAEAFALVDDGFAVVHHERYGQRLAWHDLEGDERWSVDVDGVHHLALTPNYVLASGEDRLGALDLETGHLTSQVRGISGALTVVGKRLFVSDGEVVEVAFENGSLRPLRRLPGPDALEAAASPDGKRFAFEHEGAIFIRDADGMIGRFPPGHRETISRMTFSPDGRRLVSGSADGMVLVWDLDHLPSWDSSAKSLPLRAIGSDLRQPDDQCIVDGRGVPECGEPLRRLPAARDVHELRGGRSYACAIAGPQRKVACWARTSHRTPFRPEAVPELSDAKQLGVVGKGGCTVDGANEGVCWGEPRGLRVPDGQTSWTLADDVAELRMGWDFVCFRKAADNSVWCAGTGQEILGSEEPLVGVAPRKVDINAASALAVGYEHACAVLQDRTVWCWGGGEDFTLGDGRGFSSAAPVKVAGLDDAKSVQLSRELSCTLTRSGDVWCWGRHPHLGGGLGVASKPERVATDVDELGGIRAICLRRGHDWSCL